MPKQPILLTDEIVPPPALVRAGLEALPVIIRAQGEPATAPEPVARQSIARHANGSTHRRNSGSPLEKQGVHRDGGAALDVTGDSTIAQSADLSFRNRMAVVADHAPRLDHSALDDSDSHH